MIKSILQLSNILRFSIIISITVGFNTANAQCPSSGVIFESQAQIDAFATTYPDCELINGALWIGDFTSNGASDITNLDGLSQLQGFNGEPSNIRIQNNPLLESIEGLSGFTTVTHLGIVDCEILASLDGLENLETITTWLALQKMPELTSFAPLQNVQMTGEPSIFPAVSFLLLPEITTFTGLFATNSIVDGDVSVSYMNGLTSLAGLENLNIRDGNDVQVFVNPNLQNLDGLENIDGDIRLLFIADNPLLDDITALAAANFTTTDPALNIKDNTSLSVCDIASICNLLDNNTNASINIENNASGCNDETEVIVACGLDINIVSGEVRFDFNNDGCDASDPVAPNILIETTDGATTFASFTNTDGFYQNFVEADGLVTTSVVPGSLPPFYTATPASFDTSFIGFGNEETVDFCLTATQEIDDLKITIVPNSQVVPGFNSSYAIVFENLGTTILDVDVVLTYDAVRQNFVSASPSPMNQTGNTITWSFIGVSPFSSGQINLIMNNFAPPVNQIGDAVVTSVEIQYVGDVNDASPLNNSSEVTQIYIGSYDPNDKAVIQGEEISENQVGEYLEYVVRFQNTGNANANIVRIEDVLDANLDWGTIRPLSASHAYRAEIINGNQVAFIFEDIDLPPEQTDPEGSQGYIAFQIKSKNDLLVGDIVENSASIFFDFNAPIITNTVSTVVVDTQAPEAICGSLVVSLDANGQAFITPEDIDNGSNDTNGISSLSIDIDTFDCSNLGENIVELTVEDTYGNISTCTAIVTVADTTGPVLICQSTTIQLDENGTALIDPFALIDQSNPLDNCGLDSLVASVNSVSCEDIGTTMEVTLFALDVNGNVSSCTTTVAVIDVTPPVYDESTLPIDVVRNVDASGFYTLENFTETIIAADNCNETVNLIQSLEIGMPLAVGTYTITITATDAFGNDSDHVFALTVDPLLSVAENYLEQAVLYPNPVSEVLQIDIADELDYVGITLYSILGEQLFITSEVSIDMSTRSTGIYFVKIVTQQGEITKKVVKE